MYIVQCAKHGVPLARKLANEAGRSEGGERRHIGICIGEICKYTNTNIKKTEDGQSRRWREETPASERNFPPILYLSRGKN